jgi:streptomycin 6-kinase
VRSFSTVASWSSPARPIDERGETLTEITIHDALQRTIAQFKDEGRAWLDALPQTVARLASAWDCEVGAPYTNTSVSFAAVVVSRSGRRAVLKVPIPHREAQHESDALRLWNGRGAVELLEFDQRSGAMLLETCEPGARLSDAAAPDDVSRIGGALLRKLHRSPDADHGFELLSDVMDEWAGLSRERVRAVGDRETVALVDEGAELLEALPREAGRMVVLHGDYHHWNVLAAEREPWLVIDPKPMVGDPVYDCAQFLGNRFGTRGRDAFGEELSRFADAAGFDEERVLLWCFARECENSMWFRSVDDASGSDGSIAYARFLKQLLTERRVR